MAAAFTAPPAATAASAPPAAGPSCSTFMSTGTVEGLTGVKSEVYGVVKYPAANGIPTGVHNHVPGSICQWVRTPETNGGLNNTGQLLVGYGLTAKDWKQLIPYYKRGTPGGFPIGTANSTYSPLQLGHGSKAFLTTADLGSYYGYTEGGSLEFPAYLYGVTVMTKRNNLAQVWFYPGTREKTEEWLVKEILVKDAHFF
jgi:hypothetical protein